MRTFHDTAERRHVIIAIDGACRGNPGPGGWSAIIVEDGSTRTLCGGVADTTCSRMEILAATEGLAALEMPSRVTLHTDSRYLFEGVTRWMRGWSERGWKNADGRPVRNRDLWERLTGKASRHDIAWIWCQEHSGHFRNEIADTDTAHAGPGSAIRMKTERSCA